MFASFVAEKLQDCERYSCPYDRECWHTWGLFGTGELRPYDASQGRPDVWALWPSCPRHHVEARAVVGGEAVTVAEACRWAVECGAHRRARAPARLGHLLRLWTQIKDRPEKLREHIALERSKAKRGR